jgi:ribonucleoside-diphosphate reductase alpha chain
MPATPILSNGGTDRGLPISCFLNETNDSLSGIASLWNENIWLASRGGGIGSYWGNVRSIGENISRAGTTSGIIPFLKVMDSMTTAISQGSLRRGSAAAYLPIWHPEIEEFTEIRRPTGDANRRCLNLHHGVVISDEFMEAVRDGKKWHLKSPATGEVRMELDARGLWIKLLIARLETGEPYMLFIDNVNKAIPEHHKKLGLNVKMSNLCSEITLPTGLDHLDNERTAVCCLSSLNLEKYLEWEGDEQFIEDVMRFLDNVLTDFINRAPDELSRAKYAAESERSVGLGVMGFHSFLQSQMVAIEGVMAKSWNRRIFKHIREKCDAASVKLGNERGACPDFLDACYLSAVLEEFPDILSDKTVSISDILSKKVIIDEESENKIKQRCEQLKMQGLQRFSNKIAIAPTASISTICGGVSPGIEPYNANLFVQKTLSGSFTVKNKYLKDLLKKYKQDNEDTWSSIAVSGGSVMHLAFLSTEEKDVFKTAFEIDQVWLIEHACDRTQYICQAQSLNIFLHSDISKKELHTLHFEAWKKGIKSLYYCRSKSLARADVVSLKKETTEIVQSVSESEECLSCQ